MNDLTGFQRDLLYVVVSADCPSGQGMKKEVEQCYDIEINHGRLYPNLHTLVQKGKLDRRTNYYEITDVGDNQIRERQD